MLACSICSDPAFAMSFMSEEFIEVDCIETERLLYKKSE
jgi:hypothetical protein